VDFVVLDLDGVENAANFGWVEPGVIQVYAELIEGLFEVDVVFPECIVGVEDQVLAGHHRFPRCGFAAEEKTKPFTCSAAQICGITKRSQLASEGA
jgi:hypothetical protein